MALPAEAARLLSGLGAVPADADADAIARAWAHAPYLRGLLRRRDTALATYLADGPDTVVARALAAIDSADADGTVLREAKADVALVVALADLSGRWPLEKVTAALSDLADRAIDRAIRIAVAERVPDAGPDGFVALALGKHGSRELNYSSDVDLVLLYDRARLARRDGDDPDTAAVRVARRVVDLLQTRDSAGYVFRVDLRLRPSPEVTPIAMPVGGAIAYYQSEALAWERAAFIRARAVGGDVAMGRAFLAEIEPFVWRRSLDYTAIRDIQDISLRIRDHFDDHQQVGPGYDLKRGRGGIREVEFFAQIHQLIFGGRDYALRAPATLDALAALAASARINADEAAMLASAYRFLRTAEHRLQMVDDAQTHAVPTRAAERKEVAQLAGYRDWASLERELKRYSGPVGRAYDALIAETERDRLPRDARPLAATLKAAGIGPARELAALIGKWRGRTYRALRSDAAQRQLETALPGLVAAFGDAATGREALLRFDDFLAALPTSIQFFALIDANPRLARLLARVLEMAPLLAGKLARRPEVLDIMLGSEAFEPLPPLDALVDSLAERTDRQPAFEMKLDEVRRWVGERRFQIGVQLVEGGVDPLRAARDYAKLADASIAVLADAVAAEFALQHGRVPGGRLLVLGLGRYGGAMLTEKSDLDLVYLFSGPHDAMSDGPKPLPATTWFNRLGQRLTGALSVSTAAGPLYEVDTRLRPSGKQGLLAVNLETFARYQLEEAWSWEHMALTRARVVYGSAEDRAGVEAAIAAALMKRRDPERLKAEVLEMRGDMVATHGDGGLWDVKHAAGGLIDVEFIVHYLQLARREGFDSDLGAAVAHFIGAGVLPAEIGAAHDLMTRLLIVLRLVDGADPVKLSAEVRAMFARAAQCDDFDALKVALAAAKNAVIAVWVQVFGGKRRGSK
jgi:glutamate-ammonia-ligase adenylyltransferase